MSLGSTDEDPTDFEGLYPVPGVLPVTSTKPRKDPRTNASTAAQAAGVRAFTAQAVAFYFRAPAKAFFRTRVDYLAYARNLQQHNAALANDATSRRLAWLRSTTPGVIASAVRYYGWRVIPEQILPPLIANVSVGAVLYTSYLQILGHLHEESGKASKRVYPPPSPGETFSAGFLAGSLQSVVAAPLDAIQVRYERHDSSAGHGRTVGQPQSMWTFGKEKVREIGTKGIFAGYGLSLLKDSFGSAVFFSTFEYIKAQGYYNFIRWYYGSLNRDVVETLVRKRPHHSHHKHQGLEDFLSTTDTRTSHSTEPDITTIKPHYAIEPGFLFVAGLGASVAQSLVIYPLHHIQVEHWTHLEELDSQANRLRHTPRLEGHRKWRMMRVYYQAYQETWHQCIRAAAVEAGGKVGRWLYRGFWWNTLRQLPSTSAGLIIFELVRRKYGLASDEFVHAKTSDSVQADSTAQTTVMPSAPVERIYACPSLDPTCWTWAETCNDSGVGQTVCNRAGTVFCCNSVAGKTCTTTANQINDCISNFTSPNSGVSTAQANEVYLSALGVSNVTETTQTVDPTPFSTRDFASSSVSSSSSSSPDASAITTSSTASHGSSPAPTSGTAADAQSTTGAAASSSSSSSGLSGGAIAGIVIGAIAALAIIGGVFFLLGRKRRSNRQNHPDPKETPDTSAGSAAYVSAHEKTNMGTYYGGQSRTGVSDLRIDGNRMVEMPVMDTAPGSRNAPTRHEMP